MKNLVFFLNILHAMSSILAQDISGQLRDSSTQLPVEYANIGIVGKNIGSLSDSLGNFQLSLNKALDNDTLRISALGYRSKSFPIGALRISNLPKILLLEEKIVELNEVMISAVKPEVVQLGLKKKYGYPIPLYKGAQSKIAFPQKGYRHEIGTRFSNTKTMILDSVQLNFAECNVEDVRLRINVYSIKNEQMENVLSRPVYISLSKEQALNFPIIKFTKNRILIDSDFLITVDNYKQLKDGALYFLANFKNKGKPYPTYYRHSSQGNWVLHKTKKNRTVGISILAFAH